MVSSIVRSEDAHYVAVSGLQLHCRVGMVQWVQEAVPGRLARQLELIPSGGEMSWRSDGRKVVGSKSMSFGV